MRHPFWSLIMAPFAGAAFALFLPAVGFVLVGEAIWKWLSARRHK